MGRNAAAFDAVGGAVPVICDGGVGRGSDIVRALVLGATTCMSGRPYFYGLGAAGEAGVDHVLGLFDDCLRQDHGAVRRATVADITSDLLAPPTRWARRRGNLRAV